MFCLIENEGTSITGKSSNHIRILRLVPGLVDITGMIYFLDNIDFNLHRSFFVTAIAADLAPFFVIVLGEGESTFGELYLSYLDVVLFVIGSLSAEKKTMRCIWFVGDASTINSSMVSKKRKHLLKCPRNISIDILLLVWEPLRRQGGPFESSAEKAVIEVGRVFLPLLVFWKRTRLVNRPIRKQTPRNRRQHGIARYWDEY